MSEYTAQDYAYAADQAAARTGTVREYNALRSLYGLLHAHAGPIKIVPADAVVLDKNTARYAVTALIGSTNHGDRHCAHAIRKALLRFSKPEEPKELGSVIEDENELEWVKADFSDVPWRSVGGDWAPWCDIHVVKIKKGDNQ